MRRKNKRCDVQKNATVIIKMMTSEVFVQWCFYTIEKV